MELSTTTRAAALSAVLAGSLALTACGASNETDTSSGGGTAGSSGSAQLSGTLNGAGSSAQQAAMQGWTAGFGQQQSGVTVNYDPVGSGGGRDQFVAGGVDFAGSDAALTGDQLTAATQRCGDPGIFELPNYISAIAVVYNLPGVALDLSPETTAKIFRGEITTWNDPAIAADNPGEQLPATKITPVHRGDNSGTTSNFTDYLNKAASSVWTDKASGDWPKSLAGEAANGTAGVISAVQAGEGAIGYADESQAGDLGIAKVKVGDQFVAPSAEAAAAVVGSSQRVSDRGQYDFALQINRTPTDAGQYPVVLVSYHIGCVKQSDKTKADLLKAFEGYVISAEGQQAAAQQAGSAPISDQLRQQSQTAVDAITAG